MTLVIFWVVLALLFFYFLVSTLIANGMAMTLRRPIDKTPTSFGLAFEDISFHSRIDNVSLKGWYIPSGSDSTIIVMAGGKQTRADPTIKLLELCIDLAKKGFNILTFDRRGCGQSEASSLGGRSRLDRDFGGAVDYIWNRNGSGENIYLLGVSVAAVAALTFAEEDNTVKAVISDSCYASTQEMARRVMGKYCKAFILFEPGAIWMGRLIFGLDKESAIDKVPRITCPIFFINGAEDESVPPEDTHRLVKASNNPLDETWIVTGAGHSQSYSTYPEEYATRVVAFLEDKGGR